MKMQFSLATLLVCITVLASVSVIATRPVHEEHWKMPPPVTTHVFLTGPDGVVIDDTYPEPKVDWNSLKFTVTRAPTWSEMARRLAWVGPLAIALLVTVLWATRRLKSRRHTELPVG